MLTAGPLGEEGAPVETGYAVMVDGEALPYLPDPLAAAIAARIFVIQIFRPTRFIPIRLYDGTEWPDALPFKIEIFEDPADAPHYDAAERTLFIPLPKAARATLRLSVRPTAKALKRPRRLELAHSGAAAADDHDRRTTDDQGKMASRGQHWMLTPWRNIELVHAVQRPLITPELMKLEVERPFAVTYALPAFVATCSIKSTDRLDLRATWNEPLEDLKDKRPKNVPRIDHAFSIKMTDKQSFGGNHEYRDEGPDLISAGGISHDRLKPKMHEFHDTRYRRIEYWLEGTTKFREFLTPALLTEKVGTKVVPTEKNIMVTGTKVRKWVKCSAAPPVPEVLYIVPTFGWVRTDDETTKKSWRRGGGLRVYPIVHGAYQATEKCLPWCCREQAFAKIRTRSRRTSH